MKQLRISFRGSSRVGVLREKISGINFASVRSQGTNRQTSPLTYSVHVRGMA